MQDDIILETSELTKHFNGFCAVKDVSLRITRHSIHALIGPNGTGKSTCFALISKFLTPSSGSISFNGRDITKATAGAIARQGLARSFQISAVFPTLSVYENIRLALQSREGKLGDLWCSDNVLGRFRDRAAELAAAVGLERYFNVTASDLSYGRKRALEIATTLALDPEMLLLDEPMAGLGREDIVNVTKLISQVAIGRTVLMVEHNMKVIAKLSDKITVLQRGQVLAEGDYLSVSNDPRVVDAYVGRGHA